mgnify:CR=1 FL=1
MGFWGIVRRVVIESDIVLLILDVRMPELSINKDLEDIIAQYNRRLILVFTKIDLVSHNYLDFVRHKYRDAFFVSGSRNIGINELKRDLLILAKRMKIKDPRIGVVGYPNIGKSAIINAIAKRARAKVSAKAGTTRGIQWIRVGDMKILDSPGVIPIIDDEVKLGILGSKNPEKLKNPERVASAIVKLFLDYDRSIFENYYSIKIDDIDLVFEEIAKKKGFLLKGGIIDERRAALAIIKDWQDGKLRL